MGCVLRRLPGVGRHLLRRDPRRDPSRGQWHRGLAGRDGRPPSMAAVGRPSSTGAATGAARTTGPRTPKGVQTRARLVDAAMRVFAENSLLDARISDIARRAGLSYGAFYHYFESKEELFREVATTAVERLGALVNNLILDDSPSAPLAERLRVGIRSHFETYSDEVRIL